MKPFVKALLETLVFIIIIFAFIVGLLLIDQSASAQSLSSYNNGVTLDVLVYRAPAPSLSSAAESITIITPERIRLVFPKKNLITIITNTDTLELEVKHPHYNQQYFDRNNPQQLYMVLKSTIPFFLEIIPLMPYTSSNMKMVRITPNLPYSSR